ncbi:hypothetical protein K474DRAFT_1676100 [Panus rudis PR-1116 ss-1]|nr:hypothetical protein K474DRAFT_1676100 [Panus rudis PR-1116 ss-1]
MSLALLVYDTILTFSQEVRCIWLRKWSGVTLLYTIIRYITLVDVTMQVFGYLLIPKDAQGCNILYYSGVVADLLSFIAIAVVWRLTPIHHYFNQIWATVWVLDKLWRINVCIYYIALDSLLELLLYALI